MIDDMTTTAVEAQQGWWVGRPVTVNGESDGNTTSQPDINSAANSMMPAQPIVTVTIPEGRPTCTITRHED